jgi:hypothetical protein
MREAAPSYIVRAMPRSSYAIHWREDGGARRAGRLQVGRLHILFAASGERLALPIEEVASVDYSRGELHLHRRRGPTITIGNLDAPGALFEVASRLVRGGG